MKDTIFTGRFGRPLALASALIIILLITAGLQSARAANNSALKRTLQTYDKAKGYVADWMITIQLGQNPPIRHRVSIEWKDNHHLIFTMEPDGQPPVTVAYLAVDVKSVLDGKNQWTLLPKRNIYTRDPLPKTDSHNPLASFLPPFPELKEFSANQTAQASTQNVHVYEAVQGAMHIKVQVDPVNDRFKEIDYSAMTSLGELTVIAEPKQETFNQKLMNRQFKFAAPIGAKEVSSAELGYTGLLVGAHVVKTHQK
ncbi:MAG: hypothetical protein M1330_02025 [Armatimonadetes bacterium]|nr:hypothetical protein [Armatimonadota bacterium]